MERYFYKAAVGSEVGKRLVAFVVKCQKAASAADDFVRQCGGKEYIENMLYMAGGVIGIIVPEGSTAFADADVWMTFDVAGVGLCALPNVKEDFNHKAARERDHDAEPLTMAEEIELARVALPIVTVSEFADILSVNNDSKHVVREMPSFFRYLPKQDKDMPEKECWYICTTFECNASELEPIAEKVFYRKRLAALNTGVMK